MLVFVISILTTRGWSSPIAHVQYSTKSTFLHGTSNQNFLFHSVSHMGEKKMFSLKKKTKTNPCLPHGIYIFLILKKKNYILFTCFTREKLLLFFIFFSVSEMAKKLRNLNRLAWQKCLFHQFSSHKHKRENILDQTIKKKILYLPLRASTEHWLWLLSFLSLWLSLLLYSFYFMLSFYISVIFFFWFISLYLLCPLGCCYTQSLSYLICTLTI